jgi:ribosome-associated protein
VDQRPPIRDVGIRDETIRLGQLLKLAGLVEDGASAREVLEAGEVTVNGRDETRRGRQVVPGDVVALGGERVRVRHVDA